MFTNSLASACLLASAQAMMNFKNQVAGSLDFLTPMNLAQTGSGDCCCSVLPCMPMCSDPCQEEDIIIPDPIDVVALPTPVRDVVFNLDVILTTLMH